MPRGEDEIRFQLSAEHTPVDVDAVLEILAQAIAPEGRSPREG